MEILPGWEAWGDRLKNHEREREATRRLKRELGQFSCQAKSPVWWQDLTGAGNWNGTIE